VGARHLPLALAALLALAGCARAPQGPPDVVVILLDTLRPDHLGFLGYERETAPFLARLARESTVFESATSSAPWTAPATASLFTGLYPTQHGVDKNIRRLEGYAVPALEGDRVRAADANVVSVSRMRSDVETLPELFRAAGWRTFGIATNLNIGAESGFHRGFDRFLRMDMLRTGPEQRRRQVAAGNLDSASAEAVWEILLEWEPEIRASDPFFLYLHLNDPHRPYNMREPWFRESEDDDARMISAYDSEISFVDGVLARIYERFELDENAVVLVVSDHGEGFGEHGRYQHGWGLYDELVRILWMVRAPDQGVRARTSREPVSIVDVLPTLLGLVGAPSPQERSGRDLAPLLRGEREDETERPVFAHLAGTLPDGRAVVQWAVRAGRLKLIDAWGRVELYDTAVDPAERTDLAAARPELAAALQGLLGPLRDAGAEGPEALRLEVDPETIEALRALGYAD